jgi:hypothetical protein
MYKIKRKSDRARCWFGRIENRYLSSKRYLEGLSPLVLITLLATAFETSRRCCEHDRVIRTEQKEQKSDVKDLEARRQPAQRNEQEKKWKRKWRTKQAWKESNSGWEDTDDVKESKTINIEQLLHTAKIHINI